MTDTKQPEALRLAEILEGDYCPDWLYEQGVDEVAAELRRLHAENTRLAALAEAQQPAPKASQQAAPSTDQVEEILRERDDAEDFIDALLDEVLGHERPEWSSAYGRADALNDVRERMTALHKPAVDKAWDQFQSAMEAPQQPAPSAAAAVGTNTKTAELLSTTVGLLMGYREGGARQPYKPGSVVAKVIDEVVDHLKDWPYPEPAPTPQEDSAPSEPAKHDPRKLQLQGLILSLARLSCVPPMAPALEHQLERLAAFYFDNGDEKFAQKLVMLRRGAFANGRRSVLVPSAAPTPQADSVTAPAGLAWRPIDTAPKDGTPVLLRSKKGRIADGTWITATSSHGGWAWAYVNQEPVEWCRLPSTTSQADSQPVPVLDSLALMKVVMRADEALAGCCTRGTTNWAAGIGKAVQSAVLAARAPEDSVLEDAARLDWLQANSCDLRCIGVPTGGDDYDINWVVIEHYQAKPHEREIGRSYQDDPRGAIDAARKQGANHD